MNTPRKTRLLLSLLPPILFGLAGCMVGPDYVRPDVATPAAFKEAGAETPPAGPWKTAEPQDDRPRGDWWTIYGDGELDALVGQVAAANQNVVAAAAQYRQALALVDSARAAGYPSLSTGFSGSRGQGVSNSSSTVNPTANAPITTSTRLSFSASWEADVWGRIGRNVEANEASALASAADLRAALLSAQATLVQTYCQLRVNDEQQSLLRRTAEAYARSLEITRNRYQAGVAGKVDVAQAETQLNNTRAQLVDLGIQRAQYEHAIAVLIGQPPASFSLPPREGLPSLPAIPPAVPSTLLERRPDIAGAERRMAAANAQIGVAQAAFFPALTLTGNGGWQNTGINDLISLPHRFWSLAPALALTLFDAGARSAQKASAVAAYDKSVASYRQTVLAAFQEVEDNLAALRQLAEEATVQAAATHAAREALELTENQYNAGTVSYLNVVVIRAQALSAERSSLDVEGRRLAASAALLKALGGNWQAAATSGVAGAPTAALPAR